MNGPSSAWGNGKMSRLTRGDFVGGPPPTAPIEHIDAHAIMKDNRSKTIAQSMYAGLFLIGLVLVVGFCYAIMRDYGLQVASLSAIGAGVVYASVLRLLRRFMDSRAQWSKTVQRLNEEKSR